MLHTPRSSTSRGLLGRPDWLREQALYNPRLVYALLGRRLGAPPRQLAGRAEELACGLDGWQIVNFSACFNSTEEDQVVEIEACGDLPCVDSWLYAIDYTIWRKNWGSGSLLKGQDDAGLKEVTYVGVEEFRIRSFCTHIIAGSPTPLENFARDFESHCPSGIILASACLALDGQLRLRRTLVDDEVPFEVRISLHVLTLGMDYAPVAAMDESDVVEGLRTLGVLPAGR